MDASQEDNPPLPSLSRKESREGQRKVAPFTPAQRWIAERQIMSLCIAIAIIVPLVCLKWVSSSMDSMRAGLWTVQVDDAGAFTIAPARLSTGADGVFKEMAIQATELSLRRNSKGLSYPEFVDRLFVGMARETLYAHAKATLADRVQRNLIDAPEITAVEQLDKTSTAATYRVTGVVIRSGSVDGYAVRDRGNFTVLIKLDPQPELTVRGRYPYVVSQWAIKCKWDSGGSDMWGSGMKTITR